MADIADLKSAAYLRVGSNPTTGTKCEVSSMAEQGTHNPLAVGSSPTPRTIFLRIVFTRARRDWTPIFDSPFGEPALHYILVSTLWVLISTM